MEPGALKSSKPFRPQKAGNLRNPFLVLLLWKLHSDQHMDTVISSVKEEEYLADYFIYLSIY